MKKFLICVLILALLAAVGCAVFVYGGASSLENRQKAIVETAVAYYNRGFSIQYDSAALTRMSLDGTGAYANQRETEGRSPEDAVLSDRMFSVCSSFCWEIYHDALGVELSDYQLFKTAYINALPKDDPMVAYRYSTLDKDNTITLEQAVTEAWELLQPGDIINSGDPYGHAMIFVGDIMGDGKDYLIHCAGVKYSIAEGKDAVEAHGAIRCEDAYTYCFDLSGKGGYDLTLHETFTILRPLNAFNAFNAPLTDSAKTRLRYPGINIDRQATKSRHQSVVPGEEITITIKIENCGKEIFTVPVTEVIPENAVLKEDSVTGGGSVSGRKIKWSVSVEPGRDEKLSYTVVAGGERGDVIKLEGGNVAGIRSNSFHISVSGKGLTDEQLSALQDIDSEENIEKFSGKGYVGIEFANAVYEELLGISPNMVSITEYLTNIIERKYTAGSHSRMLFLKAPEDASFNKYVDMMIPSYIGGKSFYAEKWEDRLVHLNPNKNLQAGDVVLMNRRPYTDSVDKCYVILGDGRAAYLEDDTVKVSNAVMVLEPVFSYEFFVGLRPSLAYDDLSALAE